MAGPTASKPRASCRSRGCSPISADAARGVLVVDDDKRFALTLAAALARRGYAAHVANDAAAALETARTKEPEAAVVDLKLGADDGLKLIEPLRRAHPRMRIIVLTGSASIATAVKAIKLGADDYLAKSVTASAVVAMLERRTLRRKLAKRPAKS